MTVSTAVMAGAMLGLSVAAPFGPVSLLCVQRSITIGRSSGLLTGLGGASAHGLFAFAAIAGAQAIAERMVYWDHPMRVLSALLLITLGLRSWRRRPANQTGSGSISGRAAYSSTLFLALSNPMTILPYAAVASGVAFSGAAATPFSSWSVLGVIIGAMGWYAVLSAGTAYFCKGLSARTTRLLNQAAGATLIGLGLLVLLR